MRTTVTLADDLAARLEQEIQRTGRPFNDTLNAVVRRGLDVSTREESGKRFVVRAADLMARDGVNFDSIPRLLEQVEGPRHR
ncbi:MAG: hypothetical protein GY856_18900 [bacterium]|nr:hypothetical protein [bacterium]